MTACGQHHFEQSENIVFNKRTQNDVIPTMQIKLLYGKKVLLCKNDVDLPTVRSIINLRLSICLDFGIIFKNHAYQGGYNGKNDFESIR